jgi:Domain of unknown function (DUF4388)
VSLIGSLEQFNLSNVLQRVEAYAKTGLLIVRQEEKWVELSFQQGYLLCIGPVQPNSTLGERLLQARVISQQALREVANFLGPSQYSETRTAIALIDFGYVNRESLYTWAVREASRILRVLLTCSTGEIYFEEQSQPPADRLLIALSVGTLLQQLADVPALRPAGVSMTPAAIAQAQPSPAPVILDSPTLYDASQFLDNGGDNVPFIPSPFSPEAPVLNLARDTDPLPFSPATLHPPQRAVEPVAPRRRVDTSFMQPHMVLLPTNLSTLREQNPQLQLTPEQWRLFTRADGQTTLQMACQALVMLPQQVCQIAGELLALGLVTISSGIQDVVSAGIGNSYAPMPGISASFMPVPGGASNFSVPIETHSQWGNGGNGATFVLGGGGWVVASSPIQQSSGPFDVNSRDYAQVGGVR